MVKGVEERVGKVGCMNSVFISFQTPFYSLSSGWNLKLYSKLKERYAVGMHFWCAFEGLEVVKIDFSDVRIERFRKCI
jgi:hypothetical protein